MNSSLPTCIGRDNEPELLKAYFFDSGRKLGEATIDNSKKFIQALSSDYFSNSRIVDMMSNLYRIFSTQIIFQLINVPMNLLISQAHDSISLDFRFYFISIFNARSKLSSKINKNKN